MREALTDIRPVFINQAGIAIQKSASCAGAGQDDAFVRCIGCILFQKLSALQPHRRREAFDIALGKLDGGHATAIRARCAIDLVFHPFGNAAKNTVGMVAAFKMTPKTLILGSLFFTEYLNLN